MQDLEALSGKSLAELREIASVFGIDGSKLKKRELIARITESGAPTDATPRPTCLLYTSPSPRDI